jgi:hypothetical protein
MKLDALRRVWIALAIVPLMAGVALGSVPAMFVCRGDTIARTSCCCPNAQLGSSESQAKNASLSERCCCDLSQMKSSGAAAMAATRAAAPARIQIVFAAATVDLQSLEKTSRVWPAERLAHPPPLAVPILLGKQSFLI